MNQTDALPRRNTHTKLRAFIISIALHLIALTVLAVVRFSQADGLSDNGMVIPTAQVAAVRKLIESKPIMPKPKIKYSPVRSAAKPADKLLMPPAFETTRGDITNWTDVAKSSASASLSPLSEVKISPHRIEFFGSYTDSRKICYVVDSSGSMHGIFGSVQEKLKQSISKLQPDQFFCIIFFGNGQLLEFGNGRMVRATGKNKSAAYDFIELTRPAGRTNATVALERAVQIRDIGGEPPSVIYFLTDGFELGTDRQKFSQKIRTLLQRYAAETKINTIGFWPAESDREMLEIVADQSGGEAIIITDTK